MSYVLRLTITFLRDIKPEELYFITKKRMILIRIEMSFCYLKSSVILKQEILNGGVFEFEVIRKYVQNPFKYLRRRVLRK